MPQSSSKTLAPHPAGAAGLGARPSKSAMPRPRPRPDELLEEVLLRFPPHEPAGLVRAALVCRRWCRLVSAASFRRRFRKFHRSPPMLGMLCNRYDGHVTTARFIPTTAFCTPRTDFRDNMRVLDARHGRVLFRKGVSVLAVWDPITNEVLELPFPEKRLVWVSLTAAILCSTGACDHLDCHHGPFLVVFVCTKYCNTVVYTYSSDTAAWSQPVISQDYIFTSSMGSALVGNALYFRSYDPMGNKTLKYNFELRQISMIQLPSSLSMASLLESLPTTMEDGGLGIVNIDISKLYMWSRKDTCEVDGIWERRVTIDLNTAFPVDVDVTKLRVIGSGVGIIFMETGDEVYTIDLKTYKVKKVYEGTTHTVVPYMSFYTPALEAACSSEEPSAGGSSAW